MSFEERGIYITILCHMADKGKLSEEHMNNICKSYVFSTELKSKFKRDDNDLFYNERLLLEVEKRRNYCLSRKQNREISYVKHMENENENINKNKIEVLNVNQTSTNRQSAKTKPNMVSKSKPEFNDVIHYFKELGIPSEAQLFFDFYQSKGWVVGKSPMKDWKAAARGWKFRNEQRNIKENNIKKTSRFLDGRTLLQEKS